MEPHEKFDLRHHARTTAVFVIPPRVHLLDISGPAHVFYEATVYGAPLDLHFVSVHPDVENEVSSSGLAFARLDDFRKISLKKNDLVFLPGIESHYLTNGAFYKTITPFFKWLVTQHQQGAKICSVCTGAFLLARSGLLNGKQTTTHWKYHDLLKKENPQVTVLANRLFVQSEQIYSSAGVASGIDLSLYLLEELYGTRFSATIAREVVIYLRRGKDDSQLSVFLQYRNHLEDRIHTIQEWLTHHLDKRFTADTLAAMIHTSERNLTRLFKETTGITIGQYIEKLRVEHAVQLLQEHQKVETVAKACGLKSTNQLRSLLRKHAGILPSDILS